MMLVVTRNDMEGNASSSTAPPTILLVLTPRRPAHYLHTPSHKCVRAHNCIHMVHAEVLLITPESCMKRSAFSRHSNHK